MSGTSLDGADAALADLSAATPKVLAFASAPFEPQLRARLLKLCGPGEDSLDLAGEASLELAAVYADVVRAVLASSGRSARDVKAIGCHGQTVRHRPEKRFTLQLNDPACVAELTGIDVVADFRRRDMAAGGEGAPLMPAFHEAVFRHPTISRAVVNLGGIGNVTGLPARGAIVGFDSGPANVLMDAWIGKSRGKAFDEDGRWAAGGKVDAGLLERLMQEPYLAAPPPKSTGRELFTLGWLESRLVPGLDAADVQATLAEYTALTVIDAIDRYCPSTAEIYLAGGGARNAHLFSRIAARAHPRRVALSDALGVPTGQVEPLGFAWLAMKCVERRAVDFSKITGARGPRILGAIYPA